MTIRLPTTSVFHSIEELMFSNKCENLKATLKAILLKTTKTQLSILLPWFESMNAVKQTVAIVKELEF